MAAGRRRLPRLVPLAVLAVVVVASAGLAPAARAASPWYLALGDSYSSGLGAEEHPSGPCRRSAGAFGPRWSSTSAGQAYDFVFAACAGAETRHIIHDAQTEAGEDEPQIVQLEDRAEGAALVTITIGGNDARFGEIVAYCAKGFRSCTRLYGEGGERGDERDWIEDQVRPALVETYDRLAAAAPHDRVLVLTYPQIFQTEQDCRRDAGINHGEKRWIREQTSHLNDVISEEAERAGLEVLDVEDAFSGHEICTAEPFAAGIGQAGAFHPNAAGYEVLTERLAAAA